MTNLALPSDEQRQFQLDFFMITDDVIHDIRRLKPKLMTYAKSALENLFSHLDYDPDVSYYFATAENIHYLRAGMLAHCDTVFSARYDDAYYLEVDQIGMRHSKLDYPSHAYTAAYSNMLASITNLALTDKRALRAADLASLSRISIYDMELTMGAFFRHQLEKQAALSADCGKIRHLL
jgi:methyl-accepting chemotaxis protein